MNVRFQFPKKVNCQSFNVPEYPSRAAQIVLVEWSLENSTSDLVFILIKILSLTAYKQSYVINRSNSWIAINIYVNHVLINTIFTGSFNVEITWLITSNSSAVISQWEKLMSQSDRLSSQTLCKHFPKCLKPSSFMFLFHERFSLIYKHMIELI